MAEPRGMQRDTGGGTPVPRPRHSQDPPRVPLLVAVPRCRWPGRWLPGWPPATGRAEVTVRLSPRQGHRAEGHGAGGRPPGATGVGAVPMALPRCHRGARGGRGVLGQSWGSLGSPCSRVPPPCPLMSLQCHKHPHNKRTPPFLSPPPQHRGLFRLRRQEQPQNVSAGGAAGASGPKSAPPTPEPPHPTAMGSPGWDTGNPPPRFGGGGPSWETLLGGQRGGAQLRDPGWLQGGDPRFGRGDTQGTPRWGQGAPRRKSQGGGTQRPPAGGVSRGLHGEPRAPHQEPQRKGGHGEV